MKQMLVPRMRYGNDPGIIIALDEPMNTKDVEAGAPPSEPGKREAAPPTTSDSSNPKKAAKTSKGGGPSKTTKA
jgi:hypothetical protein